jgi:hypothetical protein
LLVAVVVVEPNGVVVEVLVHLSLEHLQFHHHKLSQLVLVVEVAM